MREKPESCRGCPAFEKGRGYVPGSGNPDARLALVGQGPGYEEVGGTWSTSYQEMVYEPFIGRAGHELKGWLYKVGVSRSEVWLDNVVRCLLVNSSGKDREPTKAEADFCTRAHLFPQLAQLRNLNTVVALGTAAMRALMGPTKGERHAGTAVRVELRDPSDDLEGSLRADSLREG